MEVLPATGGDGDVFRMLAERLRAGRLVCLLADRDLTASGVEVEFFGATARCPPGPAALAIETGAALLPVTLWYEDASWRRPRPRRDPRARRGRAAGRRSRR